MIYNNNDINIVGIPAAGNTYTINGVEYALTRLNGEITFKKFVPYLGFGWSGRASKTGFSFKSDIGVMYQGSPKATLTATGSAAPLLAADLAAEEAKLNKDLSDFKIYPVISIGLGYAF